MPIWDLAVLGRGSAAAYYLNTLDKADWQKYPQILVIGEDDPWVQKRGTNPQDAGDPVNIVNHTKQMIGHFEAVVPGYTEGGYDALYKRSEWAEANAKVIDACTDGLVKKKLWYVGQDDTLLGTRIFVIQVEGGEWYFANKVVVATGAGEHTVPPEARDVRRQRPDLVLNMDEFAQRIPTLALNGKTVFILGGNAGIDTVETALHNQARVCWLLRAKGIGKPSDPILLGTRHQIYAQRQEYFNYHGDLRLQINGNRVQVETLVLDDQDPSRINPLLGLANYFVYAVGQNAAPAMDFIDRGLMTRLEPIFDDNQRFGQVYETGLGFQLEGSDRTQGLEIVGALASQVGKSVPIDAFDRAYRKRMEAALDELRTRIFGLPALYSLISDTDETLVKSLIDIPNVQAVQAALRRVLPLVRSLFPTWERRVETIGNLMVSYFQARDYFERKSASAAGDRARFWSDLLANPASQLTSSVVQAPQLGTIRSGTAAQNGFIPQYVKTGDANFSTDDRTMLRVYIALNYPYVTEDEAQAVIQSILGSRKQIGDGWGYSPQDVQAIKKTLETMNREGWVEVQRIKTEGAYAVSLSGY